MLRTNLATRPFYNDRAVKAVIGGLGLVAIVLTVFNATEVLRLQGQTRDARDTISRNDAQSSELRDKAAGIRRAIDASKLQAVQAAAREANALIDRRTFSWTELLNHFQSTLPADVRIGGVLPQIDAEGRRVVQITVFSRRIEEIETFMDALEKTGAFSGVLPRTDRPEDDGTIKTELQAYYTPVAERSAAASPEMAPGQAGTAPAASDTSKDTSNGNASAGPVVATKPAAKGERR